MEDLISTTFEMKDIFTLVFYITSLILLIHIVVFAYHWYSFGASKKHSLFGIVIHLIGSAVLIVMLGISLWYI